MISLFVSLAALGLAAVDPIGIAAMPILLVQKKPYVRSFAFLGGSFVSLMVMGLLFAKGFGALVLRVENANSWLVPSVELVAGLVLLGISGTLLYQARTGHLSVEPSERMARRLQLNNISLFLFGAGLVAVQSLIDVVFVIAMIRIGQLNLSTFTLFAAIMTYSIAALVLQIAVVVAYRLTPTKQKSQVLGKVDVLLKRYANQALIIISFALGCGLLISAALA